MPVSLHFRFCVRCYEPHKKPWSYCITCDKKRIFQILAAFIFCLKSTFSALALELQFPTPLRVVLLCFATPSLQIPNAMAASRLRRTVAAFVILLSFAARLHESFLEWLHEGCETNLLADFLHFGTSVVFVARRFRAVWSVGREECSVKCEVWRKQWEVRSVKCGVWSLSLECEARSVKCEVWGLECEGSSGKWEVWSVKCEVRSVKCEVWSVKFQVRSAKSAVWRLCFVSRWKNQTVVEGRTRSGQGVFEL